MDFHNNKVLLFVFSIAIFQMAATFVAAQECANLKEPCDFLGKNGKPCCEGMVCSITMSSEKLATNNTFLKRECIIDEAAPTCREPGQLCGNLDTTSATFENNDMRPLSANTTCCDGLKCDSSSQICKYPGLECRKDGQPCGNHNNEFHLDDYEKAMLSSNSDCCPGFICGALNSCYKASEILECVKEDKSCRVQGCCEGLNCNSIGIDRNGEQHYRCQKKTCQSTAGSCDIFNNNCCDGYYCYNRFILWGGLCLRDGTTLH